MEMIIKGVDTIEFKIIVEQASSDFRKFIDDLRESANKDKIEKDIPLEKKHFKLSFITSKYYRIILRNEDFAIYFMDDFSDYNYNIKVKLSSKFIWTNGYKNAYEDALSFVENLLGTSKIKEEKPLLRIDFCFDSDEIKFVASDIKGFVTYARKVNQRYERENQKYKLTGYEIGNINGDIFLRIYNKTLEIESSGKYWFKDIWKKNNWNEAEGKEVWRVEYKIKKKVLNELRIFTFEDFVKKEKELWKYLTNDWFKIKSRRNKNNYNSKIKRKWKKVQKSVSLETDKIATRKPYRVGDLDSYYNQLLGLLTSIAAINNNFNQEENIEELVKKINQKQKIKEQTFEEMAETKNQDMDL